MKDANKGLVIMVGNRFYSSHTKKRITTAWSLAGSKIFQASGIDKDTQPIMELLKEKGYSPEIKEISVNI